MRPHHTHLYGLFPVLCNTPNSTTSTLHKVDRLHEAHTSSAHSLFDPHIHVFTRFHFSFTASTLAGTAYRDCTILGGGTVSPDTIAIRKDFIWGTQNKRDQLLGKGNAPRKVVALSIITQNGNVHAAYLPHFGFHGLGATIYIASKSNNPYKPKLVGLNGNVLNDAYVLLPKYVLSEPTEVAEIKAKGFTVFYTFAKQDYPTLGPHLPVPYALAGDEFFIIKGPKSLPLVQNDTPYHGPADDDALAVLSINHGEVVSKTFFAMNEHFSATAQAFLLEQSNSFSDAVFKKPHSSRPTCLTFTTLVNKLSEEVEDSAKATIALVDTEIAAFKNLLVIPRRILPVNEIDLLDNNTLGTTDDTEPLSINKSRILVIGQYMCLDDDGTPALPIITKEGATILQTKRQKDFNTLYADRLHQIEHNWNEDVNASPLQSSGELNEDTIAMSAYAASCIVRIIRSLIASL